jgi:alkylated DNA nucleotide flippase Atl1
VATYGQVAALAGLPGQPRLVGYALSALPEGSGVPWHRVVNSFGRVSPRSGGRESDRLQEVLLRREGVRFGPGGAISLERFRWTPDVESVSLRASETGRTGRSRGIMKSNATTVDGYLRRLPEDRRIVVAAVREVIRENIPEGYREAVNWGAITWEVPLARYPDTYNGQPLCYVALAAQKNHYAVYLMGVYGDPAQAQWLEAEFLKAGKKLEMGKACLRFRKLDDLPLGVIGKAVSRVRVKDFLARYEEIRAGTKTGLRKAAAGKAPGKSPKKAPKKVLKKAPKKAPRKSPAKPPAKARSKGPKPAAGARKP